MNYETGIDALFATYTSLLPMKKDDEDHLWQKFRLDWNYNSNRIEGNSLTYAETHALFILGTVPKRLKRDIREMKAHDVGIEYLRGLANDERPISENDICELNKIIFKQNYWITTETEDGNVTQREIVPGTYKKTSNYVVLRGGGIHKFSEPFEVKARMASTVKSIRTYVKKPDSSLPKFLAELHHDFINTHPFDDGNGRVCRMLLNYVCLKLGWPPVIIKDKYKDDYLLALEQSDDGNLAALETLMKSELEWSLKKAISAARGEDIEDADDNDKEIQNFVNEHTQIYRTDNNVERLHFNCTIPLMEKLENKITQFEQLFDVFDKTLQATDFLYKIQNKQMLDRKTLNFAYYLREYKSDVYNADIQTNISVIVSSHHYKINCEVRSHNGQQSKLIDFSQTDYNVPIREDTIDKFCSNIGRAILEIVKEYKLKSTET